MSSRRRTTLLVGALVSIGAVAVPSIVSTSAGAVPDERSSDAFEQQIPTVFVPIEHFRAYDTRTGTGEFDGKMVVGGDGPFDAARVVDVARRAGDEDPASREIPADAVAVSFNVTVAQTVGSGFVHVGAPTVQSGESSTVNWYDADQTVANGGVAIVGTTDAEVVLFVGVDIGGTSGASAHVIIDVTGYYVPADSV